MCSYLVKLRLGVTPTEVDDICALVEADTTYSGYCSQKYFYGNLLYHYQDCYIYQDYFGYLYSINLSDFFYADLRKYGLAWLL